MEGEMAAQRGGDVVWMAGEGDDEVVVTKPNRDSQARSQEDRR
jgi:hypothetical protein